MGLRLSDNLGRCTWELKESMDSGISHEGFGEIWRHPNTEPQELVASSDGYPQCRFAILYQWQRVGRRIDLVPIRYHELKDGVWSDVTATYAK